METLNIALIYCGKGRSWTEKELSYFDIFDSLLILDIVERIDNKWISNIFNTLDKLDKTIKTSKKVFVSLPYSPLSFVFDSNGNLKPLKEVFPIVLSHFDEMKAFIEIVYKNFLSKNYSNLQLLGFYWNNETYWYGDDHFDFLLMPLLSLHIRNRGLKFLWIPASSDKGVDIRNRDIAIKIKNLHIFDYVILQPNYYQDCHGHDVNDLISVNELCKKEGIGIEIEFDKLIFKDKEHEKKALEYFKYVNNDLIGYYMDDKAFPKCAKERHLIYQKIIEKINASSERRQEVRHYEDK